MVTSSSKLKEDFDALTWKRLKNICNRERHYILTHYWNIQALDVDNLISEAIKALIACERKYSSEDKGFEQSLHDVIRRRMSHEFGRRSNKRRNYREVSLEDMSSRLESEERSPHEEEDCEKTWARVCELIGDDEHILKIIEIRRENHGPPIKRQELASRLEVSLKEINNALKRLNRIRLKIREERTDV